MGNIKLVSGRGRNSNRGKSKRAENKRDENRYVKNKPVRDSLNDDKRAKDKRANYKRAKKRRGNGLRTAFIIILIFLVGVVALVYSLGIYVSRLNTVFPNVWADGISLAGLTLEESVSTLIEMGYESNAKNVSATVVFPDDSSFTISGNEAGFAFNAYDAAIAAFEFGREGTFFENERAYVRSLFNRTDLRDLSASKFDQDLVRTVAAEHARTFNEFIINNAYAIEDDRITVIKGTGIEPADEEEVFSLAVSTLLQAMDLQKHLTAKYIPKAAEIKEVDLNLLFNTIHIDPIDAVYDPATYSATEGSTGLTFDLAEAQSRLDRAAVGLEVTIPLLVIEPTVTKEQIDSMLFRDVLSERKTRIEGTSNRLNNVNLSTAAVDGTLLNPGEIFSFNGVVGRRTEERGYKEANAYIGGMTVLEVGGGICQTSSTLYDCVLHTDLEVIERLPHRYVVAYLPHGNDATINWGTIDFRFLNNTDYPIRIDATVTGRELHVLLIGTKLDDGYIVVESVEISRTPPQLIRREDESVPQGETVVYTSGYTGYIVDTYKHYYDGEDNFLSKKLVGRSTYRVQDRVILIPVELPPESASPSETTEPPDQTSPTEPTGPSGPAETTEPPESPSPSEPPDTPGPSESSGPAESPGEGVPPTPGPSEDPPVTIDPPPPQETSDVTIDN